MKLAFPAWQIPTLPIVGSDERFPVRRAFCMGLNYLDHKKEMGITGDVPPFVFTKAVNHVVPCEAGETTAIGYPTKTGNYQWECEYTVAIGKRGSRIAAQNAYEHVFGYAVGLDLTRRDLQLWCKDAGLPWEIGKDVEQSGPVGPITPASKMGHPTSAPLWLKCNGESKQTSNIDRLILGVPGIIAWLSEYYTLEPGDIVLTGTPAGIGPTKPGDIIEAGVGDLTPLRLRVTE
ncbi:MAG TPA: fumarylacetoacetate hydrolase family protein [Burkholderiales bacterium]|nr:fumarylacetoacetate hydrolase family protein [Burkholderiales bacterium]